MNTEKTFGGHANGDMPALQTLTAGALAKTSAPYGCLPRRAKTQ